MSLSQGRKRVLNIANLHALIAPNPRSLGAKYGDDNTRVLNASSFFDSQSLPQSYSQSNSQQSSGTPGLDEPKFSFPRLSTEEDNSPFGRPATSSQKSSTELLHFSELQYARKTIQDHEDSISKISTSLTVFQEDVKTLCSEVRSLKAEIKDTSSSAEVITEVEHRIKSNENTTASLQADISRQSKILEQVDTLNDAVHELLVLYKNTAANTENVLKKRLIELNTEQIRRCDEMEQSILQMQERKFNELRRELAAMWEEKGPLGEINEEPASNSFDDVFNVDNVSQFVVTPSSPQKKRRCTP